ncbi:response regulator transcription factor [Microbacterium sp. BK668]|uniref:response regulator transcription factor n=1 Tax=Microbacterium sp. BK668 TaxID=2512118 RepID=UPI0010600BB9|nr:response regulator transcription factor [Microbacterium sp. BK668]TDN90742.1 LuxR family two component transcriptional regulator [Microbacterium sp. BK668]
MRAVIADDTLITREGLAFLLADAGLDVVGAASDGAALLRLVAEYRPDVAIVDIRMPPTYRDEGIVAAREIRRDYPGTAVLILSQYLEPAYAMRMLTDYPERTGYLLKERVNELAVLTDALRRLSEGETVVDPTIVARLMHRPRPDGALDALTPRERDVLACVAEGLTNEGIGARLFISERTVESHVANVFDKLGLTASTHSHRRVLAALLYLRETRQ